MAVFLFGFLFDIHTAHHCFPHRALNSDNITENNIANIFSTHRKLMEFIFKPQNRASPPHLFECPMHGLPASSSRYGSKPLLWPPSFHLSCWLLVLAQGPRQSDTGPYEALKISREGNFYLSVPSWSKRSAIVIVDQKGQSSKISGISPSGKFAENLMSSMGHPKCLAFGLELLNRKV